MIAEPLLSIVLTKFNGSQPSIENCLKVINSLPLNYSAFYLPATAQFGRIL